MLFVEFRFFVFFLIVFGVYWTLQSNRARKILLLIASYVFYAAFFLSSPAPEGKSLPDGWWFPFMLMASTAMDYIVGIKVETEEGLRRKLWMTVSIIINIGVLVYFKYTNFFLDTAVAFTHWIGFPASRFTLNIILPVGVSFYTFQSMSYTIEVYRKHRPAERSVLNLATFIAFFPQLVAGPIVRAMVFLPQLNEKRRWSDVDVRGALMLFMVGFAKKACISDSLAPYVDQYFSAPQTYTALSGLIATLLYSVQIFCDFSGYTDMAIAVARLLGYELTINFNFPYFSQSVTEFWRRWHISLSTWLRDYLYISLGGNRGSKLFNYRNLFLTMLLGGLWHGSRWTFVIWGALHGVALIMHREWNYRTPSLATLREKPAYRFAATLLTFYIINLAWAFFRAADLTKPMSGSDFDRAMIVLSAMHGFAPHIAAGKKLLSIDPNLLWAFVVLAFIHWLNFKRVFSHWWRACSDETFAAAYGCSAAVLLLFMPMKYAPFIYFQF